jgi:hypothetical protein
MNHPKKIVESPINPDDYREFMLLYNGGNFTGNCFDSSSGINLALQKLYSLGKGGHTNLNAWFMVDDCPRAYLKGIIVIGSDGGGGKVMLAMRGTQSGTVYYLDDEELLRPPSGYVKIAGSFSELMDGLKPYGPWAQGI